MNIKKVSSFILGAAVLTQVLIPTVSASTTKYILNKDVKGYVDSLKAKSKKNSTVVYKKGTYYVYKKANGMINISKSTTSAGAWINPSDNKTSTKKTSSTSKKSTSLTATKVGIYNSDKTKFTLKVKTYGYVNASDAKNQKNAKVVYTPREYYIYAKYNGMINVSKSKTQPGAWINPDSTKKVTATIAQTSSTSVKTVNTTSGSSLTYTLSEFKYRGIINWSGYKFSYYSQSVLPGNGLQIPGRHVSKTGYVSDKDGYIVLAAKGKKGNVINTPFGAKGKVYDYCTGCAYNQYDVYIK